MKQFPIVLFLVLAIISCKKDPTPPDSAPPDLGASMKIDYDLSCADCILEFKTTTTKVEYDRTIVRGTYNSSRTITTLKATEEVTISTERPTMSINYKMKVDGVVKQQFSGEIKAETPYKNSYTFK